MTTKTKTTQPNKLLAPGPRQFRKAVFFRLPFAHTRRFVSPLIPSQKKTGGARYFLLGGLPSPSSLVRQFVLLHISFHFIPQRRSHFALSLNSKSNNNKNTRTALTMSRAISVIHRVRTILPPLCVSQTSVKQAFVAAASKHAPNFRDTKWMEQCFDKSLIESRYLMYDPVEALDDKHFAPNAIRARHWAEWREEFFWKKYGPLAGEAAQAVLKASDIDAADVRHLLTCTGTTNGLGIDQAAKVLHGMLPRNVQRSNLIGLGCGGGAGSMNRANEFLRGNPKQAAMVMAVDGYGRQIPWAYQTLLRNYDAHIDRKVWYRNVFLPLVILSDAASAVVLLGREHPRFDKAVFQDGSLGIVDSESLTVPETDHVVGFTASELGQFGMLSSLIPDSAGKYGEEVIRTLLHRNGLHPKDIAHWIIHPGGAKVLHKLEKSLQLPSTAFASSYHVLRHYGNATSPAVLMVLQHKLSQMPPATSREHIVMLAVGPGVTLEALLLERHPTPFIDGTTSAQPNGDMSGATVL